MLLQQLYIQREEYYSRNEQEKTIVCQLRIIELCSVEDVQSEVDLLQTIFNQTYNAVEGSPALLDSLLFFFCKRLSTTPEFKLLSCKDIQRLTELTSWYYCLIVNEETITNILQDIFQTVQEVFGTNSEHYIMLNVYSINYFYINFDSAYALGLFQAIYEFNLDNYYEIDPVEFSDMFLYVGCEYNGQGKRLDLAKELLNTSYQLRCICFGEESIYSCFALLMLAENYFLSGDYAKAADFTEALINTSDRAGESRSHIRCYAAVIKANTFLYRGIRNQKVFSLLGSALDNLAKTPREEGLYPILYCSVHFACSLYYAYMYDIKQQELHAQLAYQFLKDIGAKNEYYIFAINNFAATLMGSGRVQRSKELILEGLQVVDEYGLSETAAAGYLYHTAALLNEDEILGLSSQEMLKKAIQNTSDNGINAGMVFFRINYAMNLLKTTVITSSMLTKVSNIISQLEHIINSSLQQSLELPAHLDKLKALYWFRAGNLTLARNFVAQAIEKARKHPDLLFAITAGMLPFMQELLERSALTKLIFELVDGMWQRNSAVLAQDDSLHIMQALQVNSVILNLVVSLSENKQLDCEIEWVYEVIANGKASLTLLLQERKRLQALHAESDIYRQIYKLQRQIIADNTGRLFRGEGVSDQAAEYAKRVLELSIKDSSLKPGLRKISFSEISSKLPEKSILVDYFCYSNDLDDPKLKDLRYAVYVLYRLDGKVKLLQKSSLDFLEIRKWLFPLTAAMLARKNLWLTPALADVGRLFLYYQLIHPIADLLANNVYTIYISPDYDLFRLPFALLGHKPDEYLLNKYKILYIDSARDLGNDSMINLDNAKAIIAGNAAFTLNKDTEELPFPISKHKAEPLPLSKVEARLIGEKLASEPFLRNRATKYLLEDSDADIIHIATHGCYLDIGEDEKKPYTNPLQRSCMFFAGVNDWMRTGQTLDQYGNGILTAEEIYLADMAAPSLVFLSACFSAIGEQDFSNGIVGLRTAFKANRAKVIVLSIWEVDDLAGAVLTDRFYDNLKTMPAAEALRQAQLYLKEITIAELHRNMWFDESRLRRIGCNADDLRTMAKLARHHKPFAHQKYWGGYLITV